MSAWKFRNKMLQAASASEDKRPKRITVQVSFHEDIYILMARISRATDLPVSLIAADAAHAQKVFLDRMARDTEKVAPKERLKRELGAKKKKSPSMAAIKKFAEDKKHGNNSPKN